jgi:predicted ArsR family transcriptional regulator
MSRNKGSWIMSDEEIIELVETCDEWTDNDRPVTTASELAERLDVSRQAVHKRLQSLVDEGKMQKYKPGRSAIWWRDGPGHSP